MDEWVQQLLVATEADLKSDGEFLDAKQTLRDAIGEAVSCTVRIDRPRWRSVGTSPLRSSSETGPGQLIAIRMQYQFETPSAATIFREAVCAVEIGHSESGASVSVLEMYPRLESSGPPRDVTVAFAPTISVASAKLSLGSVSANIDTGVVAPEVVAFTGEDERHPYWELRSTRGSPLRGIRSLWLLVEVSSRSGGLQISSRVTATVECQWGIFRIRPVDPTWQSLSVMEIE